MKRALVAFGGLALHEPEAGAQVVRSLLEADGFAVTLTGNSEDLGRPDIGGYDLIVPQITGGELSRDASIALEAAVRAGSGLAGFHHGLATTFPGNPRFRFMALSTFASHPGDIMRYRVDPWDTDDPIMEGISSFEHTSERYYLHVDPGVDVLATTTIDESEIPWRGGLAMPVVVKSGYGAGRIFYSALGHKPAELEVPEIRTILLRGLLWAAR